MFGVAALRLMSPSRGVLSHVFCLAMIYNTWAHPADVGWAFRADS
jgi:hypothetical protein